MRSRSIGANKEDLVESRTADEIGLRRALHNDLVADAARDATREAVFSADGAEEPDSKQSVSDQDSLQVGVCSARPGLLLPKDNNPHFEWAWRTEDSHC